MSDSDITVDEKDVLNARLDAGIPSISFSRRSEAVVQFLRYFEKEAAGISMLGSPESHAADMSLMMDAADFCLQWIAKLPEHANSPIDLTSTEVGYEECRRVFKLALDYTSMCELMTLLYQNLLTVKETSKDTFEFTHKSQVAHELEVGDWLLRKLPVPEKSEQAFSIDKDRLEAGIRREKITDHTILDHVDEAVFQYVYHWMTQVYSRDWELSGSIELEGFTLDDCRRFWCGLRACASIATYVSRNSGLEGNILYPCGVPIMTREQLVNRVAGISGLSAQLTEFLVDYYTFDIDQRLERRSHAALQPIFDLGSGLVAVSCVFALETNVERNVFDLLNIRNKKRYDKIKDRKEEEWSEMLIGTLSGDGLTAKTQMKYAGTKLDVIAIDLTKQFGIVFELKWQIGSQFLKSDHIKYLQKGFGQAKRACDWVCKNRALTEEKLKLPKGSLTCPS